MFGIDVYTDLSDEEILVYVSTWSRKSLLLWRQTFCDIFKTEWWAGKSVCTEKSNLFMVIKVQTSRHVNLWSYNMWIVGLVDISLNVKYKLKCKI